MELIITGFSQRRPSPIYRGVVYRFRAGIGFVPFAHPGVVHVQF
jgi:hypothetical protein